MHPRPRPPSRRPSARRWLAIAGALASVAPRAAWASPWTLPQGALVLTAGFNHQLASREFLDRGGAQNFPLNGRYNASTFALGLRAGFTDRLELEASIPISVVNYDSDPVVLLDRPADSLESDLDFYQRNVIDLTRSVSGVADFVVAGRYGWLRAPIALATEVRVKAPTGYRPPAGTFGETPKSREEFIGGIRRFAAPENVRDDVTLGDGQLDISASMLFGWALASGTFFRLGAGYNLRTGDAGDQLLGDVRVGQRIGERVLLYADARGAYTVETGRLIGVSVAAEDPELPASEYGGVTNLRLREVTLDRDYLDVGGGLIVRMTDRLEVNAGYSHTVAGRNVTAVHAFSMSLAFRTDFGPPAPR